MSSTNDAALHTRPQVLCISGHDPTGGAGIHADIEACAAHHVHALTVIAANTVQDTSNVSRVLPVAPMLLAQQMDALLQDCRIDAVKIGLLGDAQQIPYLVEFLAALRVPIVMDPILRAGGGGNLVTQGLQLAMLEQLLPLVTVLTPNAAEARRLAPDCKNLSDAASVLLNRGCQNILITGGDEPDEMVTNTWHRRTHTAQAWHWPRLPGGFHGAGCTLAASIAAKLAGGAELQQALEDAQAYTHRCLARALTVGQGRPIPQRL